LQGLSHKGYVSKTPLPEVRDVNRLHVQEEKRKDAAKATALRKGLRREAQEKENRRREREDLSPETTPESTPEESSSSGGVDFSESEDFKMETFGSPPPVQQRPGGEDSASAAGEKRPEPATIEKALATRADRRSPKPVEGLRSPTPAAGGRMPTPTGRRTPAPTTATGGR